MDYYYSLNGQQLGPVSLEELLTKNIEHDTLVWKDGLADWVKASEMPELASKLATVPPPITKEDIEPEPQPEYEAYVSTPEPEAPIYTPVEQPTPVEEPVEAPNALEYHETPSSEGYILDNTTMFKHFLLFKGRARRLEYWIMCLVLGFASAIMEQVPDSAYDSLGFDLFIIAFGIFVIWVALSVNTRRCHDLGHNGFWQFIPFYGIWMAFVEGEDGTNKYGNNPKG